ncbi:MAG: hypothetical protein F4X83_10290 [Chloroflexi bacterium]|nr:hypothetical protein [Chloroflexota bacterium]
MKRLLTVAVVVLFSNPAFAHVPNNCERYMTKAVANSDLTRKLSEEILVISKELGSITKIYGYGSKKWKEKRIQDIKLNHKRLKLFANTIFTLNDMISCINGSPKHQ